MEYKSHRNDVFLFIWIIRCRIQKERIRPSTKEPSSIRQSKTMMYGQDPFLFKSFPTFSLIKRRSFADLAYESVDLRWPSNSDVLEPLCNLNAQQKTRSLRCFTPITIHRLHKSTSIAKCRCSSNLPAFSHISLVKNEVGPNVTTGDLCVCHSPG